MNDKRLDSPMPEQLVTLMQEFIRKSEQNQSYLKELRKNDREDRKEMRATLKENRDCVGRINSKLSLIVEHANGQSRICKQRGRACSHKHSQYDRAIEAYPTPKEVDARYKDIKKFEEEVGSHLKVVDKSVHDKMEVIQEKVDTKMDSILTSVRTQIDGVLPSVHKRNAIVTVVASVFGVVSGWGFMAAMKKYFS